MSHEVQVREHVRIASIGAFLTLNQYTVRYAGLFGQGFSKPITRVDVYRGDSVAAILHRDCGAGRHELYLVRQFRFSTTIDPDTGAPDFSRDGRIVEIMAGSQRPEEPVRETLRRETTEETGLEIEEEIFINSFYPSPGACSEQIHLFYARVKAADPAVEARVAWGADHDEETERIAMSPDDFPQMVQRGEINDAKSLVAAEWMRRRENSSRFGLS